MPDTPRILITGSSGFIGRSLLTHLDGQNVVGTRFNSRELLPETTLVTIDLRDEARVAETLKRLEPTIVFHFAALTSPSRNDLNPTLAKASHLVVTRNILNALPSDAQIVFLSTDKVFDGTHPCPDESTVPRPSCLYGELKLACEDMIRLERPRHHILRLPIVHSDGHKSSGSFIDRAIEDLAAGRSVQAFGNVARCYVKRHELVSLLGVLVDDVNYGTYHVGTVLSSYYDRIRSLCDEAQVEWRGKMVPTEGSVRPTLQNLDTAKVSQVFDRIFS